MGVGWLLLGVYTTNLVYNALTLISGEEYHSELYSYLWWLKVPNKTAYFI